MLAVLVFIICICVCVTVFRAKFQKPDSHATDPSVTVFGIVAPIVAIAYPAISGVVLFTIIIYHLADLAGPARDLYTRFSQRIKEGVSVHS